MSSTVIYFRIWVYFTLSLLQEQFHIPLNSKLFTSHTIYSPPLSFQRGKKKKSGNPLIHKLHWSHELEINWPLNKDVKNNSGIKYIQRSRLVLILATI